jgi:hypothetical protein
VALEDLQRVRLLVRALDRYLSEHEEYSLAECLEDEHWSLAEDNGEPAPVNSVGDRFVAEELAHAYTFLDAMCERGPAPAPLLERQCQAPGCEGSAWPHWPWCLNHDLEQALRLEGGQ